MFHNHHRRSLMQIITDAFAAAYKELRGEATTLSPEELEQIKPAIEAAVTEHVKAETAALQTQIDEINGSLQTIQDAVVDPTLTAEATTAKIAEVLDVNAANAPADTTAGGTA